ncbi:hypothetical protein ACFQH6_15400 [Halobacteriaceae archaeon GCM10025711]
MDPAERFVDRYSVDESKVARYKERKRYGKRSEAGMFLALLAGLVLVWTYSRTPAPAFLTPLAGAAATVGTLVVFAAATGFWVISSSFIWRSGLTDERVAYHEIAAAMRSHEAGDLDAVLDHLHEARTYLMEANNPEHVSGAFRESAVGYVDAVSGTGTPELTVRDTFDRFAESVVTAVLGMPTQQVDAVVADVEQSPPGALDGVARARSDVRDVVSAGMFGFWGLVVVSSRPDCSSSTSTASYGAS